MDNLDCTKINAHSKNSQLVYGRGLSRWKHTLHASPTSPYVGKQLMVLFHTQLLFTTLVYSNLAPKINCMFYSPALEAPGH